MQLEHQLGQVALQIIELVGGAMLPRGIQIDSIDEFHQQITVRIFKIGQVRKINFGNRNAQALERGKLIGLAQKFAVDAMGGDFQDRAGAGGGHERESSVY